MTHGITPGPQIMRAEPDLFWGVVVSMWIGNGTLLVLNMPMVALWARLLRIPYRLLYPAIILFSCIGIYSVSNSPVDLVAATVFGLVGFMLVYLRFEPAPLLLDFILGPMMEENLHCALTLSRGDPLVLVREPISPGLLIAAVGLLVMIILPTVRVDREKVFAE